MWQHQQTYTPQDYGVGANLQTVSQSARSVTLLSLITISQGTSVPNSDLPALVAPSTGPQRSVKGAKERGKKIEKGEGKRKRIPRAAIPPGIDWPKTTRRFRAEMAKIFNPTGEVPNPETAYASFNKFVKEDLKLSVSNLFYCDRDHHLTNLFIWCQPLVVKNSEKRPYRDLEQYLIGVLNELCPRPSGQERGVRYLLERGKRFTHLHTEPIQLSPICYSHRQTRKRASRCK